MARRHGIPQKRLVFLAGEGKSELGYGRWLNRLAARLQIPVAINAHGLRGGDFLELVRAAISQLERPENRGAIFRHRAVILDIQSAGINSQRDAQAKVLATRKSLTLIWSEPCHEAFLVRHFDGYETHRPPTPREAERLLRMLWPGYRKGMDATRYEAMLTADHLTRVRTVEPHFDAFLDSMGWSRGNRP